MLRLPFPACRTLIGAEGSQVVGVVVAQMRQVRGTARSWGPVQDRGPSGPARRWVFLGLFPGPGRQGPWNRKEHTRSLALAQTSAACGRRVSVLTYFTFPQLSGSQDDALHRPPTCQLWHQAARAHTQALGPSAASLAVVSQPSSCVGNGLGWVVCVALPRPVLVAALRIWNISITAMVPLLLRSRRHPQPRLC